MKVRAIRLMFGISGCVLAAIGLSRVDLAGSTTDIAERGQTESSAARMTVSLAARTQSATTQAAGDWSYLGPDNLGGPTSWLATRPDNASIVYAVSELGSVFRSTDAGAHWTFLSQLPMQNAKLEVAADQPSVIYAYNSFYDDSFNQPTAPFKSTDGGVTWAKMQVADHSIIKDWELYAINRLRSVPGRPGVLFAATETNGLIRSADGGDSWLPVVNEATNQPFSQCSNLEIVPARNKVYSVCDLRPVVARLDGLGTGIALMQDYMGDAEQGTGERNRRIKIAVSPSNPDVVYVTGSRYDWGNPRLITHVYRSDNGGANWTVQFLRGNDFYPGTSTNPFNIALPGDFEDDCSQPSDPGFGAFEDYELAVDPANADSLWVAGREVYRSDDGGVSFGRAGVAEDLSAHALMFAPTYNGAAFQTLFTAGPSGIQRTTKARAAVQTYPTSTCEVAGAAPAVTWSTLHDGYSVARLVSGSLYGVNRDLWVSEAGLGTLLGNAAAVGDWTLLSTRVGQTLIDTSPYIGGLYISGNAPSIERLKWNGASGTWDRAEFAFEGGMLSPGFQRYSPFLERVLELIPFLGFVQEPTRGLYLATGTTNGIYHHFKYGDAWNRIGPAVAVATVGFKRDEGVLASTLEGHFLTENPTGSQNWEIRDLHGCLIVPDHTCSGASLGVQEFYLSPNKALAAMYATGTELGKPKVFYSSDNRIWQPLDRPGQAGGLPDYAGTTTLAINPDDPRHLYAGTPFGLYRSLDHGQNWAPMDTPFPGMAISKVMMDEDINHNRLLYVFTFGRGAWVLGLPSATTFVDVPAYHWAFNFIEKLADAGITGGCTHGPSRPYYCPKGQVLRDQMAVFLLRARHGGNYQPPAASGDFSDVATTFWAAAWIEQLREEGITAGCATNPLRYCPGNVVLREEMAVFLLRAKYGPGYQPPPATGLFTDVPTSSWAAPWIEQLAREGIAGGCVTSPKQYCPRAPVLREEMAVFLVRTFGL